MNFVLKDVEKSMGLPATARRKHNSTVAGNQRHYYQDNYEVCLLKSSITVRLAVGRSVKL